MLDYLTGINAVTILFVSLCVFAIGYRFYGLYIAQKVLVVDSQRATPAEKYADGQDYVKTNKFVLFGHHFAAIAAAGPLLGPVLAAQFGYLPGFLSAVFLPAVSMIWLFFSAPFVIKESLWLISLPRKSIRPQVSLPAGLY